MNKFGTHPHHLALVPHRANRDVCPQDDGVTWSKPVEITKTFDAFQKSYAGKVLATGPDHSVQLRTGRLVVPVGLSTGTGGNAHRPSVTATIYSDDAGKTCHAREIAVPCTDEWINPNEAVAIEIADGPVMLNVRSESKTHRRLVTTSKDGATGWSSRNSTTHSSNRSAGPASCATRRKPTAREMTGATKTASFFPTRTTSIAPMEKPSPAKIATEKTSP